MIVLVTTAPEFMYQPQGFEPALECLRKAVIGLANELAADKENRVLVFERSGAVGSHDGDSGRLAAIDVDEIYGDHVRAKGASAGRFADAIETFCGVGPKCCHIVAIMDADFFFSPGLELGTFSRRIDESPELIGQLNNIGEYLGALDGDLLICAAHSQSPERIAEFVSDSGWSWVRQRAGRFQLVSGPMPKAFENCCSKNQDEPRIEWSEAMLVKELAARFGITRNTMGKRLKSHEIPSQRVGRRYQVPLDRLPKK